MFFRKQNPSPSIPPWTKEKEKQMCHQNKDQSPLFLITTTNPNLKKTFFLSLFLFSWLLFLLFWFPQTNYNKNDNDNSKNDVKCTANFSVYVYNLPAEFNSGLLQDCKHLNVYTDMCPHVANRGLGRPISAVGREPESGPGRPIWFATHQFIAEMIFHARVEAHPCRTLDPSRASLFYVPFYGGLYASSKFRDANLTARDDLAFRLADFVSGQPAFKRSRGRDHFIVLGRTAWDFMRASEDGAADFGANCLLNLPAAANMSVMTVERNPWRGKNQHGIPYPSYFHPYAWQEVATLQHRVRHASRPNLFSFIGGPRKGLEKAAVRDRLIKQCAGSDRCELLRCGGPGHECHDPDRVLAVMGRSEFCLQAPGDSFTRRSTFDAVLAGCVPVFFSEHTAYTQYEWFLPEEAGEWSVFIGESDSERVEEVLAAIPGERIEKMRETVVGLIPRLTYAHPNATDKGFDDAVDVALASLANHVLVG